MKPKELKEVLRLHHLWLDGEEGGERADLSGADLRGENLRWANLKEADLRRADLREAILNGAILRGANLAGANLRDASLQASRLGGANLRDADLRGAALWHCTGNGREVQSLPAGGHKVVWTKHDVAIDFWQYTPRGWLKFGGEVLRKASQAEFEWWCEWKPRLIELGVFGGER